MQNYNWDTEFVDNNHLIGAKYLSSLSALKSCIEADEPKLMAELLGTYQNAHIFALISCFTAIPAVRCIEYLISVDTPMDVSFPYNPYMVTPLEYLDTVFDSTTHKIHVRAKEIIYNAIERGIIMRNRSKHTAPDTTKKQREHHEQYEKTHIKPAEPIIVRRISRALLI